MKSSNIKLFNIKYAAVVCACIVFSGCVGVQPFPYISRAGDTITLAIGSLDGATRDNVTVNYYADSDPLTAIDMTANVRSLLKIYPDKTSQAYWDTVSGYGTETMIFQSYNANHGPWQSIIVLDLPATVPPGFGHFNVTFGTGVSYPARSAKVDDVDIGMEILADTNGDALVGSPNNFEYRKAHFNTETNLGDLAALEPIEQVVVKYAPDLGRPKAVAAAANYHFSVPVLDAFGADVSSLVLDDDFTVVLDDQSEYLRNQVNLNWSRTNDEFNVIVTSINGLQDFHKIRFSVLIIEESLGSTNGWLLGTPGLTSAQLFDVNGNDISASLILPDVVLQ